MYPDWINSLAILGAAGGAIIFTLLSVKFNLENRIKENLGKIGIKLLFRQTMICGLIAIVVVFLLCVIPVAFMIGNFTALVGLWVGLSYPLVLMFFRPEIFDEKVRMTFPRYLIYYAFSLAAGVFMTVRGFSSRTRSYGDIFRFNRSNRASFPGLYRKSFTSKIRH